VPSELVEHRVVIGGETIAVPPVLPPPGRHQATVAAVALPPPPGGPTERLPLGTICGARPGAKGGNADLGAWGRDGAAVARPAGPPPRPGAGATSRTSCGARSPRSGGRSS